MRNKDDRLKARCASIRCHGCRGVTGRHTGNALHAESYGLRSTARHAIVFERSRRIESLMLEYQAIETAVLSRPRTGQQGSVALSETDNVSDVVKEVDEFPISPDTTLFDGGVIAASLPPQTLQPVWIDVVRAVRDFE
jgi:hypothetical protein